ncbi:SpoIIE family protein phosphatase [Kitasatospora sp. MAA19]|uniref:SpoIIE family protein phosphatase n=1 Tax=Kitasatospora sp. MAA19 TaxID=3035090 RepID=UPI002475AD45|nr:SpoIIE family protein phosphatase [Kitasatospora sp. MAA19]
MDRGHGHADVTAPRRGLLPPRQVDNEVIALHHEPCHRSSVPLSGVTPVFALGSSLGCGTAPTAAPPSRSSTVLSRTNHLLPDLDTTMLASCAHLRVDLVGRSDRLAGAGHPPPLLRTPDGRAAALAVADGPTGWRSTPSRRPSARPSALHSPASVPSRAMTWRRSDRSRRAGKQRTDVALLPVRSVRTCMDRGGSRAGRPLHGRTGDHDDRSAYGGDTGGGADAGSLRRRPRW